MSLRIVTVVALLTYLLARASFAQQAPDVLFKLDGAAYQIGSFAQGRDEYQYFPISRPFGSVLEPWRQPINQSTGIWLFLHIPRQCKIRLTVCISCS